MNKLKIGDRVKFNQDYNSCARKGDTGVVRSLSYVGGYIDVNLDKGGIAEGLNERRVDLIKPEAPHVFKLGDKGVTRDGRKYEVLAVFPNRAKPILVDVAGSVSDRYLDGSAVELRTTHSDLIPPKKTVTRYCNVNSRGEITGNYSSAAIARNCASHYAVIVARPVTIELP